MPEKGFPSSGDPQEDARIAAQIRRNDAYESEGLCPNGCAPIVWDDPYNRHCPVCGFHGYVNAPYMGAVQREG